MRKLILAGLLAPLFLSGAENRIPGRVDQGRLVTVPTHAAPGARSRLDRGPVDPRLPMDAVTLLLRPDPGLDRFLADLQNPASPDYHRWLSPEQFADRFGLSQSDIAKITSWLASQGLSVTRVARGRHWVTVSGTADRVGRAFHTEIHNFSDGQEVHYANATDPSVPEALAGIVAGFSGLDDFGPKPQMVKPLFNRGSSHSLAPDDFATIYNLKPLYSQGYDGTGQSIMVIGQTAVDLSDIQSFRAQFGLPPNDPQMVLIGTDPGKRSGDMVEADLDLEWAGAVAPKAQVIYVYSNSISTSLLSAVDQNLAPVMTLSYGGCERNFSPAWRYVAQQANAQGITWMVASGDQGAAACDFTAATPQASKGATVTWPAGIPEITAVGGTGFDESAGNYWSSTNNANGGSALSYIPEAAWNDSAVFNDLASTGGGISAWYAKPAWQKGRGVPADNARDVPDISLAASPLHVAYQITSGGKSGGVGGTSASSPAFAGIVALLNQYLTSKGVLSQPGLGNLNPTLYRLAQASPEAFHDVAAGDNRVPCAQGSPDCKEGLVGYPSGTGYDLATGLGSPDVSVLAEKWSRGTATTTTVSAATLTPALDDTVALTATVRGSGDAKPTGTVTFTADYDLLGSADLAPDGTATLTAAAVQIAGGNGVVTAAYSGDNVFDSSAGDLKISVALPDAVSAVVPSLSSNPVYQQTTSSGPVWVYSITLKEMAGKATTLTGFTIDNFSYDSQIVSFFKTASIPAQGSITTTLSAQGLTPPVDRVFRFSGMDAGGQTWVRQITVRFVGPPGPELNPGITLTSAPQSVQQNLQADPSCQWTHRLSGSGAERLHRDTDEAGDQRLRFHRPDPVHFRNHAPRSLRQPSGNRLLGRHADRIVKDVSVDRFERDRSDRDGFGDHGPLAGICCPGRIFRRTHGCGVAGDGSGAACRLDCRSEFLRRNSALVGRCAARQPDQQLAFDFAGCGQRPRDSHLAGVGSRAIARSVSRHRRRPGGGCRAAAHLDSGDVDRGPGVQHLHYRRGQRSVVYRGLRPGYALQRVRNGTGSLHPVGIVPASADLAQGSLRHGKRRDRAPLLRFARADQPADPVRSGRGSGRSGHQQ